MLDYFKNIAFYIVIASFITVLCFVVKSDYVFTFMSDKLLEILLTLLAINTATSSFIITKLKDVANDETNFKDTIIQLKLSLKEQILLVVLAFLTGIVHHSSYIDITTCDWQFFVISTFYTTLFIFALDILRDTGIAIFELFKIN